MMLKNNTLIGRIIFLALTTILFSVLVTGGLIFWSFNQLQERNLNTYLTAYIDSLIAATNIDQDGNISLNEDIKILDNMPFYWQVNVNGKPLKKAAIMQELVDVEKLSGEVIAINIGETKIRLVLKNVVFPSGNKISYLFGVQEEIAEILLKDAKQEFTSTLFVALILLAFFLIIALALIQVKAISKPLAKIKQSVAAINAGKAKEISGEFPQEIDLLAQEINKLIGHNVSIITRYSNFVSNVSHALKTPLTIINNEAQTSDSALSVVVKNKTNEMLSLIDRNLARVKAVGLDVIFRENINVVLLTDKIVRSFAKLYQKNIIVNNLSNNSTIQGNEADLYEIIGNVIENACKYCQENIVVTLENRDHYLLVSIKDDGVGVDKKYLANIIQYGVRLDTSKTGSGIGLAVVKDIVELYDGKLTFNNSDLGGLEVVISLPS